ncbi:MAG TPA: hypothetical protein VF532_08470 [Candidatus Angelobacter sp.]
MNIIYRSFWLAFLLALAIVAAGCGSGSSPSGPPITGPYSTATLSGNYAFVFSGKDAGGFFGLAGSFQANGAGGLSAGLMDINMGSGISSSVPFTGTYTVLANGQGSAMLTAAAQTFNLRFIVISSRRAMIIRFDNNSSGHGDIEQATAGSTSLASVTGTYTFNLAGIGAAAKPLLTLGAFTADGAGGITAGVQDLSDNGTLATAQAVTGSYTVATEGRGTLTLTTALGVLHFAFYMADQQHLKLVETERSPAQAGETFGGVATLSLSTLGCGPCVFALSGLSAGQAFGGAGILFHSAGTFSHTVGDSNQGGVAGSLNAAVGNITIGNFRGTLTSGASNYVFYPLAGFSPAWLMMQIDPGTMVSGLAYNQPLAGTPHLDLSFAGNYALYFIGMPFTLSTDEVGQVAATNAPSGTVAGHMDMTSAGALNSGLGISGSFTMDKTARGTTGLQTPQGTQNLILFASSGIGPVVFVGTGSNVVAGVFETQQ